MMTKDIFDPDIQDAPVYPVSFMIQNQEHLNEYPTYDFADPQIELTKDGNIDFQLLKILKTWTTLFISMFCLPMINNKKFT